MYITPYDRHTPKSRRIHIYIYIYVYIYIIHLSLSLYIYIYIYIISISLSLYIYIHIHIHTYIHIYNIHIHRCYHDRARDIWMRACLDFFGSTIAPCIVFSVSCGCILNKQICIDPYNHAIACLMKWFNIKSLTTPINQPPWVIKYQDVSAYTLQDRLPARFVARPLKRSTNNTWSKAT